MSNENSGKEKDRIEQIKKLLLSDEAIGEVLVYNVTAVQSIIQFRKSTYETISELQNAFVNKLEFVVPFKPRDKLGLNEGFLKFLINDNQIDFYYLREIASRWEFINSEKSFESMIVKKIDSSYRVRIKADFKEDKITITCFGGAENLVMRARSLVVDCLKTLVHNSEIIHTQFLPNNMQRILDKFGEEVTLVSIDPRDNEKYTKFVEITEETEKAKRERLYDVYSVRMSGLQITVSPQVKSMLKDRGIRITEIKGSLFWSLGVRISSLVKSSGRVEFYIPSRIVKNDTEAVYRVATKLYSQLVPSDEPPEKGPLERFLT